ncbi:hypothetical protein [Ferrimonas gelatinilytica]|uniref:hypothetical protein n=1 Tax=Ferrimonas gelatinilytica TaxID=1255257 RepID=UPI0031E4EEFA
MGKLTGPGYRVIEPDENHKHPNPEEEKNEVIQCPFCAEDIKSKAILCKHCKSILDWTNEIDIKKTSVKKHNESIPSGKVACIQCGIPIRMSTASTGNGKCLDCRPCQKNQAKTRILIQKKSSENKNFNNGKVCCPKCSCTQFFASKNGYAWGKGLAGGLLTGGLGLLAGFWGSNKIMVTCINCGYKWRR